MKTDAEYMQRALALARRGLYTTHPNPRVGCVIVKDGRVVGEGFHLRTGEVHAEVAALGQAGAAAHGADVYLTLEPCSHHGRTPPCCDALLKAGVGRVLIAADDPNPLVDGGGVRALAAGGVSVVHGLCADEAQRLNRGFFSRMRCGRPWVRIKSAISLDGRTALACGKSAWISGEAARRDVQFWRAQSHALMTGHGTVIADDPRLDVRLSARQLGISGRPRQPLRIVVDSKLRTSPQAAVYRRNHGRVILATCANAASRAFEDAGVTVLQFESGGKVPLDALFATLAADFEINEVQVEAGSVLCGALIEAGLCDELLLYVAPKLIGPQGRPLAQFVDIISDMNDCFEFDYDGTRMVGDDLRIVLRPRNR